MIGVPRGGLATRADFEMLQAAALAGEMRPHEVAVLRRHWQGLLNGRLAYVFDRLLGEGEAADGAGPEYLVVDAGGEAPASEPAVRAQYRLTEVPSRLDLLGFAVSDIEDALTDLEGR